MPALKVVCEGDSLDSSGARFLTSANSLDDLRGTISSRLTCKASDIVVQVEDDGERWEVVDASGWGAFIRDGIKVYASHRKSKGKKRALDQDPPGGEQAGPASKKRASQANGASGTSTSSSPRVNSQRVTAPSTPETTTTTPKKKKKNKDKGEKTPGAKTPGEKTSGQKTPGQKTPGQKTPGQKTPGQKTPGEKTPSQKTPGEKTSGQKTPGEKTAAAARGRPPTAPVPSKSAPGPSSQRQATPAAERQSWSVLSAVTPYSSRRKWNADENETLWKVIKSEVDRLDVLPVTREERVAFYQRILDRHPLTFQGRTTTALEARASTKALEAQRAGNVLPPKLLALFPRRTVVERRRSESASSAAASDSGTRARGTGSGSGSGRDPPEEARSQTPASDKTTQKKKKKDKASKKAEKAAKKSSIAATAASGSSTPSRPARVEEAMEISSDEDEANQGEGTPSSAASDTSSTLIDASIELAPAPDVPFNPFAAHAPGVQSQSVRTSARIAAAQSSQPEPSTPSVPGRQATPPSLPPQSSAFRTAVDRSEPAQDAESGSLQSFTEAVTAHVQNMGANPQPSAFKELSRQTYRLIVDHVHRLPTPGSRQRRISIALNSLYGILFTEVDSSVSIRRIAWCAASITSYIGDRMAPLLVLHGEYSLRRSLQNEFFSASLSLPWAQLDEENSKWPVLDVLAASLVCARGRSPKLGSITRRLLQRVTGGSLAIDFLSKLKAMVAYLGRHPEEARGSVSRLRKIDQALHASVAELGDPDDKNNRLASTCSQLSREISSQIAEVRAQLGQGPIPRHP